MLNHKKYLAAIALATLTLSSCSDDFLEIKPRGTDLEANYYQNQEEAFNGLVAIYDVVGMQSGGYVTKLTALNSASDDHFAGGGGPNDVTSIQVWSNYTLDPATGPQGDLWSKGFSGVFRANVLLQKLPEVPMDETLKARYAAEATFLRAYFYFDLVRLFENVPLFTEPVATSEMYNVLQADPADVYAQIEADILEALPNLPASLNLETEAGRITEGAARAILGKVYLQQEKFALAAEQFEMVNGTPGGTSQYGYKLLDNYADLFVVDNKFNSESIFEVAFTNTSNGDWGCVGCTEGNLLNIMVGPRGYNPIAENAPDYVSGWSFLTVTNDLYNAMENDPRKSSTIANLDSLEKAGAVTYEKGYNNTGYFLEKFAGRQKDRSTGGGVMELNFRQNVYELRLADSYLLEAEALVRGGGNTSRAQALLDAVRARVGLASIPVSIDSILEERRLELAGEGHRWFDLIRNGRAAEALASKGFVAGKNEILPIPLLELDNTLMEQNQEYGGTK
ncbi:RagB/SusD family nutrient uptake outer membrane protein [uncultured Algoriphagus sp.]|uniref:RagB/SusD family nutrient uptake outer membrane protein n=1 Tax=uncultured Algoriphagus sp. TaxID=417365 RepID=UPI0030EF2476|tara:strand:+ start:35307 stop:36830 length:1524 start_codon:yes stop_codon:yes gene_type:complete